MAAGLTMGATLKTERIGRVLLVRFDNPPQNLVTGGTIDELEKLVDEVAADRSLGAVVFTGVEDRFMPQYDLTEMKESADSSGHTVGPRAGALLIRMVRLIGHLPGGRQALARSPLAGVVKQQQTHHVFSRMNAADMVFIAAINGPALGIGCEFAVACDLRIMGDGAGEIGLPEMTVGTIPGAGGTQRITRLLGPGLGLELMLEGASLAPVAAQAAGLVQRVVPGDRLVEEAVATAQRLARRSPVAVSALKRAVYDGGSRRFSEGIEVERAGFLAAASQSVTRSALGVYLDEQERYGDLVWLSAEHMSRWRAGTAIDFVGNGGGIRAPAAKGDDR